MLWVISLLLCLLSVTVKRPRGIINEPENTFIKCPLSAVGSKGTVSQQVNCKVNQHVSSSRIVL